MVSSVQVRLREVPTLTVDVEGETEMEGGSVCVKEREKDRKRERERGKRQNVINQQLTVYNTHLGQSLPPRLTNRQQ